MDSHEGIVQPADNPGLSQRIVVQNLGQIIKAENVVVQGIDRIDPFHQRAANKGIGIIVDVPTQRKDHLAALEGVGAGIVVAGVGLDVKGMTFAVRLNHDFFMHRVKSPNRFPVYKNQGIRVRDRPNIKRIPALGGGVEGSAEP